RFAAVHEHVAIGAPSERIGVPIVKPRRGYHSACLAAHERELSRHRRLRPSDDRLVRERSQRACAWPTTPSDKHGRGDRIGRPPDGEILVRSMEKREAIEVLTLRAARKSRRGPERLTQSQRESD